MFLFCLLPSLFFPPLTRSYSLLYSIFLTTEQMDCSRRIHLLKMAPILHMMCMLVIVGYLLFHKTLQVALGNNLLIITINIQLMRVVSGYLTKVSQLAVTFLWQIQIRLPIQCLAVACHGVISKAKPNYLIMDKIYFFSSLTDFNAPLLCNMRKSSN